MFAPFIKLGNLFNTQNFYLHNIDKNGTKNLIIVYNFLKTTIIPLIITGIYFFYTIFFLQIQFLKQLAIWFVVGMLFFWLISGFNFFIKRYQFGKFTSQIQRFWKRTAIYFWLIEGFLICIYFYYFLNSSQEPSYMYDYASLNQEYLVPLNTIFTNIILLSTIIYFSYFILLRVNLLHVSQLIGLLLIITLFLLYSFYIETYQFVYVITSFRESIFVYIEEENLWVNEDEAPSIRVKQQYLLSCLIAKYWHFLFIFISWLFLLIKSFEKKQISFVLLGFNVQNLIILFFLNFLCYIQWFKWIYRRFFDIPYKAFFIDFNLSNLSNFFYELCYTIKNFLNINTLFAYQITVNTKSLKLFNVDSLSIWKYISFVKKKKYLLVCISFLLNSFKLYNFTIYNTSSCYIC